MNNRNRKFSRFKASYFATGNSLPKKAQSLSGDRTGIDSALFGRSFRAGDQDSTQPAGDHGSNANIAHISWSGMVSRQFLPNLASPFFIQLLNCFNVQLFEILTSQGENTNFHPDRAPHRDSNYRDSGGNAAAGSE